MAIQGDNILHILKKPRFPIGRIFLIILSVNLLVWLIGFGTMVYFPKTASSSAYAMNYKDLTTFKAISSQVLSLCFFTVFFYGLLNIFYYADVLKKKSKQYILYSVSFAIILGLYNYILNLIYPDNINKTKKIIGDNHLWFFSILGYTIWGVMFVLIVTYVLSAAKAKDEKARNQELLERNNQLEIEKLRAEYNFLKAQINPHFMHNSLNFLYSKSLPYSPELSEGILTISEIMRYALMNESNSEGLVLLSKEVDHVRNIIKMNQLRFDNKLNIELRVSDPIAGVKIIPLVLITIVENAFKHGDIRNMEHPLKIDLDIDEDYIYFSCVNKKKIGPKELSFGIGLNNTKRRLKMIYGEQATLTINESKDTYQVSLKIPYTR